MCTAAGVEKLQGSHVFPTSPSTSLTQACVQFINHLVIWHPVHIIQLVVAFLTARSSRTIHTKSACHKRRHTAVKLCTLVVWYTTRSRYITFHATDYNWHGRALFFKSQEYLSNRLQKQVREVEGVWGLLCKGKQQWDDPVCSWGPLQKNIVVWSKHEYIVVCRNCSVVVCLLLCVVFTSGVDDPQERSCPHHLCLMCKNNTGICKKFPKIIIRKCSCVVVTSTECLFWHWVYMHISRVVFQWFGFGLWLLREMRFGASSGPEALWIAEFPNPAEFSQKKRWSLARHASRQSKVWRGNVRSGILFGVWIANLALNPQLCLDFGPPKSPKIDKWHAYNKPCIQCTSACTAMFRLNSSKTNLPVCESLAQ